MNLRSLLMVNAVLGTVHGLAFVLLPSMALAFYGVSAGAGERLMGQLFGTELLVVALICWLGKGLTNGPALRAIAIAMCFPNMVGMVITAMATVGGVMNGFGWLGTAIYGGLAAGYAWVLLGNQAGSMSLAKP